MPKGSTPLMVVLTTDCTLGGRTVGGAVGAEGTQGGLVFLNIGTLG